MKTDDPENQDQNKLVEEIKLKRFLSQALSPEAYSRLMNVKVANPELFQRASALIIQYYSRYHKRIDERELIELLKQIIGRDDSDRGGIIIRRK
ncbi:MAG: hypothetical protein NZ908_00335 [Candidatus Micrarchaeota archaeon]|nr:hypothetical protein [Candidatus Micrarchaeota archaeon]MCX8154640.1 hypothetical protein [Candidatus Micrarchaeota archaeon]